MVWTLDLGFVPVDLQAKALASLSIDSRGRINASAVSGSVNSKDLLPDNGDQRATMAVGSMISSIGSLKDIVVLPYVISLATLTSLMFYVQLTHSSKCWDIYCAHRFDSREWEAPISEYIIPLLQSFRDYSCLLGPAQYVWVCEHLSSALFEHL